MPKPTQTRHRAPAMRNIPQPGCCFSAIPPRPSFASACAKRPARALAAAAPALLLPQPDTIGCGRIRKMHSAIPLRACASHRIAQNVPPCACATATPPFPVVSRKPLRAAFYTTSRPQPAPCAQRKKPNAPCRFRKRAFGFCMSICAHYTRIFSCASKIRRCVSAGLDATGTETSANDR